SMQNREDCGQWTNRQSLSATALFFNVWRARYGIRNAARLLSTARKDAGAPRLSSARWRGEGDRRAIEGGVRIVDSRIVLTPRIIVVEVIPMETAYIVTGTLTD